MVVHALRGCGLDPGYLVGGEVRSTGTNAGWGDGRVARRRGRRVRPLAAQARAADRRAHQRRARPPHDLRLAARRRRRRSARSSRWPSSAVVWDRPELLALAGDDPGDAVRRPGARAGGGRLALHARRRRGRAVGPRRPQRPQRRRRADRLPARRRRPGRGRRRAGRLHRRRPALRAPRHHARRARSWSTTTRTTRPRCAATIEAARTLGARRVVAVFQPHLFSRTRHQAREFGAALALADVVVVLGDLPGARARRRTSPASPAGSSPRRPPTPPAGGPVAWMPALRRGRGLPARRRCATATCCSRSAPATSTRSAAGCSDLPAGAGLARGGSKVGAVALDPTLPRRHGARLRAPRLPRVPLRPLLALVVLAALASAAGRGCATRRWRAVRDVEVTGVDLQRGVARCGPRSTPPAAT